MITPKQPNTFSEDAYQHLASIIASSNDAIISKSLDGTIRTWNPAAERMFGYTAPEILGQSIMLLIPEDRKQDEDIIVGKIKQGERIDHFETVRRCKDGSLIDV